jgi:predicted ester cyclase
MSDKEATLRRAVSHWNASELDRYLQMYGEEAVLHGYGQEPIGKAEAAGFYAEMMEAFPGSQVHLDDLIDVGDRLVIRYTQTGKQLGEFMGIPPSGREFSLVGICIDRHAGGKVVERYSVADMTAVFEQLGAWPQL